MSSPDERKVMLMMQQAEGYKLREENEQLQAHVARMQEILGGILRNGDIPPRLAERIEKEL